jgi:hypothetical protein
MSRTLSIICLAAAAHCCQAAKPTQVATPSLGLVHLQDGSVHEVLGVPGSFVLGPAVFHGTDSAAFSGTAGIIAFPDRLVLLDNTFAQVGQQAITGPAIVSVDGDADGAIAWLPRQKTLSFWTGNAFASVEPQGLPEGEVWSVRRTGLEAILLVGNQQATISLETGNLIDCHVVPETQREAIAKSTGQNATDLVIERMNAKYLHVSSRTGARTWVVTNESRIWELPAAAKE